MADSTNSTTDINTDINTAQALGMPSAEPLKVSQAASKKKTPRNTLAHDIRTLMVKLVIIATALVILFGVIFGFYRVSDTSMEPAMKNGDLVMIYRLDRQVNVGEVMAVTFEGRTTQARVVARAGDVIDIDDEGLVINGAHQQEQDAVGKTSQVAGGVSFPLTVPQGQVFMLGDNRETAVDSRIYGCVEIDRLDGKVMGIFRRRGF